MPTPFTHLRIGQKLLTDTSVPNTIQGFLHSHKAAFLSGSIAADARVNSGIARASTHFYHYAEPILEPLWRVMLSQHPSLHPPTSSDHAAFLAGYAAHLSVDELWKQRLLEPYFFNGTWAEDTQRYFSLHILLIYLDKRDYLLLGEAEAAALQTAVPDHWLPFLPDEALRQWGDYISQQIRHTSETLDILAERTKRSADEFRAVLDDAVQLQAQLWHYIPTALIDQLEVAMYGFAREQMLNYLNEEAEAFL